MQDSAHIAVSDFEQGVGYYTAMFGKQPAVRTHGFARWQLEDSRTQFAIRARRSTKSRQRVSTVDRPL